MVESKKNISSPKRAGVDDENSNPPYSREQVKKIQDQRKLEIMLENKKARPFSKPASVGDGNSSIPFDVPTLEEFVQYIDEFLEEYNIKPATFGRKVLNDSGAISRMKNGTNPRLSTMHKVCDGIEEIKKDQKLEKMFQEMME